MKAKILLTTCIGVSVACSPAWAETDRQTTCAAGKPLRTPDYPTDFIKRGITGSVVLRLEIDECGHVLRATVKKGDKAAFEKAALASVKGVTLTPSQRAGHESGVVDLPIDFKVSKPSYQKVDWPSTHTSPRYLLETSPLEFQSAAAADRAIASSPELIWPSPYPVQSRFVQTGAPGRREFWLFLFKEKEANFAVRYRPVIEGGESVVRVAILCSDTVDNCARANETVMQGLPYAKARR